MGNKRGRSKSKLDKMRNKESMYIRKSAIAIEKAKSYTTIEIDSDTRFTLASNYRERVTESNDLRCLVIPPLFTNYTIHTIVNGKSFNNADELISISWLSDTEYEVNWIVNNKLRCHIMVNNEEYMSDKFIDYKFFDKNSQKWDSTLAHDGILTVMTFVVSITDYMLNYSSELEYDIVEKTTVLNNIVNNNKSATKGTATNGNSTTKSTKRNNVVILSSRRNKYIITSDDVNKSKRVYNRRKPCWGVRGYYQHYGKDKVLKYIPPRINVRKDMIGDNVDVKKYIIKGDKK